MKAQVALLAMGGIVACTRGAPAPVTPLVRDTTVQAPPTTVAAAAPGAVAGSPHRSAPAVAPAAPQAPGPQAHAVPDSVKEQAFLDSLHALTADSVRRAPTAPAPTVAAEQVRREAVSLFGRPQGTAAVATWDIDVASYAAHQRVQYWVDFFAGRARWHFERYLERLGRYDSIIRGELAAAGMPQDMIYLAMIESGFNQVARSRAGAVGLWQFMPGTARRYGLTVDAWVDERRDPFVATRAAVRFLSELNSRFGSWYLAAAAYDAGPGKIQKGLDRGDYGALDGNDVFFAMAEGRFLRRETRDYVPKLIAAALIAKEPGRYGFTGLERWEPLRYDSLPVDYAVGLDVLARLAHASREGLEEMNPALFRGITPPDRSVWVRVPSGTADSVAARLSVLPEKDRVTFVTHLVGRGETLSKIARQYGLTVGELKSANRLASSQLSRGQRLQIPVSASHNWRRAASLYRDDVPVRRGHRARGSRRHPARPLWPGSSRASAPARSPIGPTSLRRVHVVRSGENLWTIAAAAHVPVSALMQANGLNRRSVLHPGQAVRIPN